MTHRYIKIISMMYRLNWMYSIQKNVYSLRVQFNAEIAAIIINELHNCTTITAL